MSDRSFTIQTRVARPVAEVFQAVVDNENLSRYFADRSSGPLVEGERVTWSWSAWGDYPVFVKRVVPNERIELELDSTEWKKTEGKGYPVRVIMEFQALTESATMVQISESGWKRDEPGLKASHENCGGWQHMALCLKGYLEHGIDLR